MKIDILTSEFKLTGQALRHYQKWLRGFEGHDNYLGRDSFKGSSLRGWDASAIISRLKKRYPRVKLSGRVKFRFASA